MSSKKHIQYTIDDRSLTADEFAILFRRVWPRKVRVAPLHDALERTINITARDQGALVGCVRVLTDGYLASCITEVLVAPEYRSSDANCESFQMSFKLLELAWKASPSSIMFGAQRADAQRMEELGWKQGPVCYFKLKESERVGEA